jgi:hypothetical protein
MTKTELPSWPAAMNLKLAAAYCGLSIDTFKEVCPVRPIQFTASAWGHRYLRQRLDEWMLSLDPNGPPKLLSMGDFFSSAPPTKRRRRRSEIGDNSPRKS